MEKKHKGMYIGVEGPDASGKSTLIADLVTRFQGIGIEPVLIREPGGTPEGERIRAILKDSELDLSPSVELSLLVAGRDALINKVILPALDEGRLVISDRTFLSSHAYQGCTLGFGYIDDVHNNIPNFLEPDLMVYVDTAKDVILERLSHEKLDRLEEGMLTRIDAVIECYNHQLNHMDNVCRVNGNCPVQDISLVAFLEIIHSPDFSEVR